MRDIADEGFDGVCPTCGQRHHAEPVSTLDEIRARLEKVRRYAKLNDYRAANNEELRLHAAVLEAICDGYMPASELAREALKSKEIRFYRFSA